MDPRLYLAIANDDVDELHRLIVEERNLLDYAPEDPFPNTPLHVAAAAGKTQVAMEIAILKPLFTRKLDPEGYSPMHLALQHKRYPTVRALMTLDPELIRVQGRGGITSLHYVAMKEGNNELELLAEFLSSCKSSIEALTSKCETAVHVAVKKNNVQAFKVLFGWLKRARLTGILNWIDEDGNTVLHIAASEGQSEIMKRLIGYTKVNVKNFKNRTALQIYEEFKNRTALQCYLEQSPFDEDVARRLRPGSTLSLSEFFSRDLTLFEKCLYTFGIQDAATRDIILVVATLIATATYQAVLSPPGGFWQDDSSNPPANSSVVAANSSAAAIEKPHQAGNIIITGSHLFLFAYLNNAAFYISVASIGVTAMSLWPHTCLVYISMVFLSVAYCVFLTIGLPKSDRTSGALLFQVLWFWLYITLALPLCLWLKYIRVVSRVDARRRRVGDIPGLKE